jgi:hypothetical protein
VQTHEYEVLQFNSVAEFQSRPQFHRELIAAAEDLEKIVGKYLLPEPKMAWTHCGLNSCDQPHRRGYIVRLRDGRETNCGHKCGSNHFGVKWEELEVALQKAETAAATRKAVESLLAQKENILARANKLISPSRAIEIRIREAQSAVRKSNSLMRQVEECARLGGAIRVEIDAPPHHGGYAIGRKGALKTAATIDGARLLVQEVISYSSVIPQLLSEEVSLWDTNTLSSKSEKELSALSRRGAALTETLDRAEQQLRIGNQLLANGNLQKLEILLKKKVRSSDITPELLKALKSIYSLQPVVLPAES